MFTEIACSLISTAPIWAIINYRVSFKSCGGIASPTGPLRRLRRVVDVAPAGPYHVTLGLHLLLINLPGGGSEDRIRSDTMPQDLSCPIANYTICKELQSDDINSSPLTFWPKSFLGLALRGV